MVGWTFFYKSPIFTIRMFTCRSDIRIRFFGALVVSFVVCTVAAAFILCCYILPFLPLLEASP